ASFAYHDPLGKPRLSLVRSVEIHELSHLVNADRSFEDGRPDMLVNDAPDNGLLPDTLYLSDGSIVPVSTADNIVLNGSVDAGNLSVTVSASAPAGWTYLRFEDPGSGQYRLAHVRRADNSEIALGTNV